MPHHRGWADFSRKGQRNVTSTSLKHCSWLSQSRCRCYWFFSAKSALELTPMLFSGQDNPQNCPFQWRSRLPSNTWFLGPTRVRPPIASQSVFFAGPQTWQMRSVCSNMPHLTHVNLSEGDWQLSTCANPTYTRRAPIRLIFGFWGNKVPQNGRFPAQNTPEPQRKIWRR